MALMAFIGFVLGAGAVLVGLYFGMKWSGPDSEAINAEDEEAPESWKMDILRQQLLQEGADQAGELARRLKEAKEKVKVPTGASFL